MKAFVVRSVIEVPERSEFENLYAVERRVWEVEHFCWWSMVFANKNDHAVFAFVLCESFSWGEMNTRLGKVWGHTHKYAWQIFLLPHKSTLLEPISSRKEHFPQILVSFPFQRSSNNPNILMKAKFSVEGHWPLP